LRFSLDIGATGSHVPHKSLYRVLAAFMKRTSVSSSESLEGKLFVQFVALIYMSFIHKVMKEKKLYMKYTMPGLLDELDIIESFEYAGSRIHYGEIRRLGSRNLYIHSQCI